MYKVIGYVKKIVKFKKKTRVSYTPIYKDLGKGKSKDKLDFRGEK